MNEAKKIGAFPFVLSGLSFIPMVGVPFGLIAIVWGLINRRSGGGKVALISAGGFAFTIILYGGIFYFGFFQRGGIFDDLRTKLAQSNLNSVVQVVEVYRLAHGQYPDSLEALKNSLPKDSTIALNLTDPRMLKFGSYGNYFCYKKIGPDHYYLRGVASDGKPFSPGALVPQIGASGANIGLLTEPPAVTQEND
jgi:hypothetical protein